VLRPPNELELLLLPPKGEELVLRPPNELEL
jgi:hypothetical protein